MILLILLSSEKVTDTPTWSKVKLRPTNGGHFFISSGIHTILVTVGQLVYLYITISNISHTMGILSQFVDALRSDHYVALLNILWYLHGTLTWSLLFSTSSKRVARIIMLIGLTILPPGDPLQVIVFSLAILVFPGKARNKMWSFCHKGGVPGYYYNQGDCAFLSSSSWLWSSYSVTYRAFIVTIRSFRSKLSIIRLALALFDNIIWPE